jgi:hypothetical protein
MCQYVGTMWEEHCNTLLQLYDDRKQSPVYKEQFILGYKIIWY